MRAMRDGLFGTLGVHHVYAFQESTSLCTPHKLNGWVAKRDVSGVKLLCLVPLNVLISPTDCIWPLCLGQIDYSFCHRTPFI